MISASEGLEPRMASMVDTRTVQKEHEPPGHRPTGDVSQGDLEADQEDGLTDSRADLVGIKTSEDVLDDLVSILLHEHVALQ